MVVWKLSMEEFMAGDLDFSLGTSKLLNLVCMVECCISGQLGHN